MAEVVKKNLEGLIRELDIMAFNLSNIITFLKEISENLRKLNLQDTNA